MEHNRTVCDPSDLYWMWLCSIKGLYWRQQKALLYFFEKPENIFHASWSEFQLFRRAGLSWIEQVEKAKTDTYLKQQIDYLKKKELFFCSRENTNFPQKLREIGDCPNGLFFRGSLPPPAMRLAGVVGARVCSTYGKMMARTLSAVLTQEGFGVVSGMAAGIDTSAGYGALEAGNLSWAVMGCGADVCYPRENAGLYNQLISKGGILSEFPPHTEPLKHHFPLRNRIISGLCEFVIVVEARARSGSLITADYALEQGRDVWVVPGRCDDPLSCGCNTLISQGAEIIVNSTDFRTKLRERYSQTQETILSSCPTSRKELQTSYPKPQNELRASVPKTQKKLQNSHLQPEEPVFDDPVTRSVFHILGSTPKTTGQILQDLDDKGDLQDIQIEERAISIALTKLILNGYADEIGKGAYILSSFKDAG